jgi:hypothetical protein
MYINGNFAGANNVVGNLASPPGGLTIGASGTSSGTKESRAFYFEGNIGIIRIYSRILNPTEIVKNFNKERIRFGL